MISVHFQGKPFNITVIQDYAPISNAEQVKVEQFYEDLQDFLELTEFCDEKALIIENSSSNTGDDTTQGHHQMVNTEIILIIFFAAKNGETLYSHQK